MSPLGAAGRQRTRDDPCNGAEVAARREPLLRTLPSLSKCLARFWSWRRKRSLITKERTVHRDAGRLRMLSLLLAVALLTACGGESVGGNRAPSLGVPVQVGSGAYTNLTPAELMVLLENKDFLLINTHAPYGYEIAQTDAHADAGLTSRSTRVGTG